MSRSAWLCGCFALALGLILTDQLFANTTGIVNDQFINKAEEIKGFLFGNGMRCVAIGSGALGLFRCFASSSGKPLLVYGGIALGAGLLQAFIDGMFPVAGMLIP